jgi:Tol biopolymer transport system component/DNA-binding winged helix-turn-helix (wHTH) protein
MDVGGNGRTRFGDFELDSVSGNLFREDRRVKIQPQPLRVLCVLLERAGETVSREQLRTRIWGDATFVEFDQGLNYCIRQIRLALRDGASKPVFIETLPKQGYRFIARVVAAPGPDEPNGANKTVTEAVAAPRQPVLLDPLFLPHARPPAGVRPDIVSGVIVTGFGADAAACSADESRSSRFSADLTKSKKWQWLWAAGGIAAVLLAVVLVWRWRETEPPEEIRPVPLTSYSGNQWTPSFSPDGRKVVFTWYQTEEDYDIYVKQIGALGTPVRLTTARGFSPAWSPDDRWIAFMRAQKDGRHALVLIPSIGGAERKLAEDVQGGEGLAWTPDGKRLAFSQDDSPLVASLWMISVETGDRRRLTTFATKSSVTNRIRLGDRWPSFSPDGRSVAFARYVNSFAAKPFTVPLTKDLRTNEEPKPVTNQDYAYLRGIAWTADSREIVYSAGGAQIQYLWRVPGSGGTPKRLTYQPAALYPAISGTPPRLAYSYSTTNLNIWRLDVRTGERKQLISSAYSSARARYSPDGRKIAFHSNRTGNIEVWTCDADGTSCLQLTKFDGPQCGSPSWSPDGQWLALDSWRGKPEIYVIAADGGALRQITNGPGSNIVPTWSLDGRWIYFSSDRTGRYEIWKTPKQGGDEVQITHSGGTYAAESPDGEYLYHRKDGQPGIFRMPVAGGEDVLVVPNAAGLYFGLTSKGLYFLVPGMLQFLDLASNKTSTLTNWDTVAANLTASPDDAYVIWEQTDKNTSNLMLVDGFR